MATQDNQDILESVETIRRRFKSETKRDPDAIKMSFLDEVNALVRKIFRDDDVDVYDAFSPGMLQKWKKRRLRRWISKIDIRKIFLFSLLITITGFLVTQALPFYALDGVISTSTWVQAILTEICFIFVSSYRAVGWLQTSIAYVARVSIFALMLFVVSSEVLMQGTNQVNEINVIAQKIEIVQEQIKSKDELIEFYKSKGWGNSAKKQSDEKDALVKELMKLKDQQIEGKNQEVSDIVQYKTWAKAFFRVVLILMSVLISRRLFSL